MQVIPIEKHHHGEHEGHKVKLNCEILRDLRVLRGRQYYIMSLELAVLQGGKVTATQSLF